MKMWSNKFGVFDPVHSAWLNFAYASLVSNTRRHQKIKQDAVSKPNTNKTALGSIIPLYACSCFTLGCSWQHSVLVAWSCCRRRKSSCWSHCCVLSSRLLHTTDPPKEQHRGFRKTASWYIVMEGKWLNAEGIIKIMQKEWPAHQWRWCPPPPSSSQRGRFVARWCWPSLVSPHSFSTSGR